MILIELQPRLNGFILAKDVGIAVVCCQPDGFCRENEKVVGLEKKIGGDVGVQTHMSGGDTTDTYGRFRQQHLLQQVKK